MDDIRKLAVQFRNAIDMAKEAGEFDKDFSFDSFPSGCCGDTSDLLAQFLLENGILTYYVCGMRGLGRDKGIQSHAWLMTDNNIIIDITGDQFRSESKFLNYDQPVYVGTADRFHKLFKVAKRDIRKNEGIETIARGCQPRLYELYGKIMKYI